jgi:hypothetical protein
MPDKIGNAERNQAEARINGAREAILNEFTAFPNLRELYVSIVFKVLAVSPCNECSEDDARKIISELFD